MSKQTTVDAKALEEALDELEILIGGLNDNADYTKARAALRVLEAALSEQPAPDHAGMRDTALEEAARIADDCSILDDTIMSIAATIRAAKGGNAHPDDLAVDCFAAAMKAKLAKKRDEGRGGWEQCEPGYLSELLRDHVEKGDPLDVGNLAMMLHQRGERIKS